jgi:hypothetical protein
MIFGIRERILSANLLDTFIEFAGIDFPVWNPVQVNEVERREFIAAGAAAKVYKVSFSFNSRDGVVRPQTQK